MCQFEIVILANSVKHGQHCIAGKCVANHRWIRPVSNEQGGELNGRQVKYQNPYGIYSVKLLQKIHMRFARQVSLPHQPENFLIDGNVWQQNYSINSLDLVNYIDEPQDLWGHGNRVSYAWIVSGFYIIQQSLYLIRVSQLNLYKNNENKRRCSFTYNGIVYDLAVTDPNFDAILRDNRGLVDILCVSLGENYHGYCYKLVATIFLR